MKTNLFLSLIVLNLFLHRAANAQAPPWLWAQGAGGASYDQGQGIATDASGNVYVTGYFESPSITFGSYTLTNAGADDIFVVKYDAGGNVLWAKSAGGSALDYGSGIATDASGNVYVTGSFAVSSITFDTITLTCNGFSDIFTVKYDGSGNVLWAKKQGGGSFENSNGIATDPSGNVYITGKFRSAPMTVGSFTLMNSTSSTYDIFSIKYDSNGNVIWAKSSGGSENDMGYSIAADANGNAYVTGEFSSSSITFGSTTLTNPGNAGTPTPDIFIVKYDASGNAQWAKSAGGPPGDYGYSITTDAGNNVYISGYTNSGPITFGSITLTNLSSSLFLVKYDPAGNALWANIVGGISAGYGLSTDANANVYLTGKFQGASVTFGSTTLTNAGGIDMFIAKYDSSGNPLWAKSAGGTVGDYGLSIAAGSGEVYVTGYFNSSSITFGSDTLTNAGSGTGDVFTAKLNGVAGAEENISPYTIAVFPNPFSAELVITDKTYSPSEIFLYDMTGRKIFSRSFSHSVSINTEQLDVGIYFYRIKTMNGIVTSGKVIKQ